MKRVSDKKTTPSPIENGAVSDESKRTYPVVGFSAWTGDRELSTFGNNVGSPILAFQRWRHFKEAFAPEIVQRAVGETKGPVRHIVDPFGGSGTTALAAQFLGVRSTSIEVNPFLADLIEAKLATYDLDLVVAAFRRLIDDVFRNPRADYPYFPRAPRTFVEPGIDGRYVFSKKVAERLASFRRAIDNVSDLSFRRLFRVILASVTVPVSNVTINGKGRRYRGGWTNKTADPSTVDDLFKKGVLNALYDLRRYSARGCRQYTVECGDARRSAYTTGPCDLAVFSPPYPNSFDYTDVYNIELWTMGYLDGREANARLRNATLRSHVQIKRDMSANERVSPTLFKTVNRLRDELGNLWNRNIPDMIAAYSADITTVLAGLATNLRPAGRVYTVVGDSRYAGIDVPTAHILSEIAPLVGYEVVNMEPFRSMRASPQQGGRLELPETLVVLERTDSHKSSLAGVRGAPEDWSGVMSRNRVASS